jgi:hypothetical protein
MGVVRIMVIGTFALALSHQAYAAENLLPTPDQIVSCSIESGPRLSKGAWRPPPVKCESLSAFLSSAKVVTKKEWLHNYSHVALADSEGILKLRSGSTIRWLLRPGGLGRLIFPDGGELYLVKCCGK